MIAWIADIEKTFLIISVAPKDRDALRFLWVTNIDFDDPEIIALRFARVVFGISSSPFLLNTTIKYHIEKYSPLHPEIVRVLMQSIYVDDVVSGGDSEDEAYTLYKTFKQILSQASFNLQKFVTSSPTLQGQINREDIPKKSTPSQAAEPTNIKAMEDSYIEATLLSPTANRPREQRVLGVCWNIQCDQLVFEFSGIANAAALLMPTKRNMISIIG